MLNETIKSYDSQYLAIFNNIVNFGKVEDGNVRAVWEDGEKAYTKSLRNQVITLDASIDSGRMTGKFVGKNNPVNELFWIWKDQSNDVQLLNSKYNCKVWNEWQDEGGTIGKAYGYQLGKLAREVKPTKLLAEMILDGRIISENAYSESDRKLVYNEIMKTVEGKEDAYINYMYLNQVDWLLYMLTSEEHKYSRRLIVSLWNVEELDEMELEPCVYESRWEIWGGKLNVTVGVRSNDMGLGNPYNVYQYTMLLRMIAQVTGNEVGTITFFIHNAHIYDRHIEDMKNHYNNIDGEKLTSQKISLNKNVKSFYDFTSEDIIVEEEYNHHGKLKLEVAI